MGAALKSLFASLALPAGGSARAQGSDASAETAHKTRGLPGLEGALGATNGTSKRKQPRGEELNRHPEDRMQAENIIPTRATSNKIPAFHLAAVYAAQAKLLIEREIPETHDLIEFRKLHDLTEVLQHVVIVLEQIDDKKVESQSLFGIFE